MAPKQAQMGVGRHPHRPPYLHRQRPVPRHHAKHRDEVDRPLRLQSHEVLHRHRGLHQGELDDEVWWGDKVLEIISQKNTAHWNARIGRNLQYYRHFHPLSCIFTFMRAICYVFTGDENVAKRMIIGGRLPPLNLCIIRRAVAVFSELSATAKVATILREGQVCGQRRHRIRPRQSGASLDVRVPLLIQKTAISPSDTIRGISFPSIKQDSLVV